MAYTFGGGTGDDITVTTGQNLNGNNIALLCAGWYFPTTLTATRHYWSGGNVVGLSVDTTTDELRFITDNTTDGVYTTTGADILVNEWVFIALLTSGTNTGPAGACRIWVGREVTPPVEVTVTQATAPVGNYTGSTARYIGNRGTGTLSFIGDIGWVSQINDSGATIGGTFNIAAAGAITNDEALFNYNRWVLPLWLGNPSLQYNIPSLAATNFTVLHFPLNVGGVAYLWSHDPAFNSTVELTTNGATLSQRLPPRTPPENWPIKMPLRAA